MSSDNWFEKFFGPEYFSIYDFLLDKERIRREVELIISVLDPIPGCKILDIPCGFGRHSLELASRGFAVTGVDLNRAQLDKARELMEEAGVNYKLIRGDMRDEMFHGEFDLLLNLFTSFGYFSDEENARVAVNFYKALKPGVDYPDTWNYNACFFCYLFSDHC